MIYKKSMVKNIVITKRLKIRYSKLLNSLFILARITKYKSFSMQISPHFPFGFEQGSFCVGIDLWYRLKNVDHLGFNLTIELIFMTLDIEFTDWRHVEDYKKADNEK